MAISDIKKGFGGGMREKPEKASAPPPEKEEKKDTSGFGGKPYLSGGQFRQWLGKPELYSRTGIPEVKRLEFEKAIRPKYHTLLEKGEPERIIRDLETGQFKLPAGITKGQAIRLLKELSGKK